MALLNHSGKVKGNQKGIPALSLQPKTSNVGKRSIINVTYDSGQNPKQIGTIMHASVVEYTIKYKSNSSGGIILFQSILLW